MKKAIIIFIVVIIVGIGGYLVMKNMSGDNIVQTEVTPSPSPVTVATTTTTKDSSKTVLGKSVGDREIAAYHFGTGSKEIVFIGGMHGGYSANTVDVANELMDYLKAAPTAVPKNVKVTVIPVMNPDGLNKGSGAVGRFNGNNVDLNRNFDCNWQASGTWQSRTVSGGSKAFSEPESMALKNYVDKNKPTAVVAYYSAAGGVYASSCDDGISAETRSLVNTYAKAAGYPARDEFDAYALTGDMVNWFAKNNVPAISVLLTNHKDSEWTKNKAGIEAVLKSFAQ